ncbi:MAG: hypothetical protein ACI9KE_001380 [Polyangiales bacterium]|jgi:hypothetical protein
MNRISICTVLFVLTSTASAQDVLLVTDIGGESVSSSDVARVGIAECESATDVVATVSTIMGTDEVDLWFGVNLDCSTVAERDSVDGECVHIGHADTGINSFTISIQDLIAAKPATCDSNENQVTVYALYTTTNPDRAAVDGFGTVTIEFDGVPPDAPDISGAEVAGDSAVTLNWELINDEDASFELINGGECLGTPPSGDETAFTTTEQRTDSATVDPEADLGLELNESAAVYIVAVDLAGNRSVVSEPICVTRVPVAGFCDVFSEMGGADCGEAGCSVAAPGSGGSGAPLFFMLVALLWTRRS